MLGQDYGFSAYNRGGPRKYSYSYAPATLGQDNGEEKEKEKEKKSDPVWFRTLELVADKGSSVAQDYLRSQIANAENETAANRFRMYLSDVKSGKANGNGGFSFDVNEAMPWIIGGVVVLIAGSVIMGTRKRRR